MGSYLCLLRVGHKIIRSLEFSLLIFEHPLTLNRNPKLLTINIRGIKEKQSFMSKNCGSLYSSYNLVDGLFSTNYRTYSKQHVPEKVDGKSFLVLGKTHVYCWQCYR